MKAYKVLMIVGVLMIPILTLAQNQFSYQALVNDSLIFGDLKWGDYDGDGDQDLLAIGVNSSNVQQASIFEKDSSGLFTDINTPFMGVQNGTCDFVDIDNDNDLDVLLSGTISGMHTKIYINTNGTFQEVDYGVVNVGFSSTEWVDLDHDGDKDLIILGADDNYAGITKVYENRIDTLVEMSAGSSLPGFWFGDVDYTDLDMDGDVDVILTGSDAGYAAYSGVYEFQGDSFVFQSQIIEPLTQARAQFADLDNDGYEDLVLMGVDQNYDDRFLIYKNDSGTLVLSQSIDSINSGFTESPFSIGDFDNDGDADIVFGGYDDNYIYQMHYYRNDNMTFVVDQNSGFPYFGGNSSTAVTDIDGDLDLDIVFTGYDDATIEPVPLTLFTNNEASLNTSPTAPTNITSMVNSNSNVVLNWNEGSDQETPAAGLTYNLGIQNSISGEWLISPLSLNDGTRMVSESGNMLNHMTYEADSLSPGIYHWMVQSIDQSYVPSTLAIDSFVISDLTAFDQLLPYDNSAYTIIPDMDSIGFEWESSANAMNYRLTLYDSVTGTVVFQNTTADTVMAVDHQTMFNHAIQNNQPGSTLTYYWRIMAYGQYDSLLSVGSFHLNLTLGQYPVEFDLITPADDEMITLDFQDQSTLNFSWESSYGATSYMLEVSGINDGLFSSPVLIETNIADTTFDVVIADLAPLLQTEGHQIDETETYYWRVSGINQYDTVTATLFRLDITLIDSTTGVLSVLNSNEIQVYPNPFNERLTINNSQGSFVIYNLSGQEVFKSTGNASTVNVLTSEWPEGMYILNYTQDNTPKSIKLVK